MFFANTAPVSKLIVIKHQSKQKYLNSFSFDILFFKQKETFTFGEVQKNKK
jgi:hypothetical protein